MEDNTPPVSVESQSYLPDVVHSQQLSTSAGVERNNNTDALQVTPGQNHDESQKSTHPELVVTETSQTESISELLPSRVDYSLSDIDNEHSEKKPSENALINILSVSSEHHTIEPSHNSTSWNNDVNAPDVQHISEESPLNLVLPSDVSGEPISDATPSLKQHDSLASHESNFADSLNEPSSNISADNGKSLSNDNVSSGSEVIKLDIRGSAAQKFIFPTEKIFFGPPPEGSNIIESDVTSQIPVFQNLLPPLFVGAEDVIIDADHAVVEEVFDSLDSAKKQSHEGNKVDGSPQESFTSEKSEQDVLVEELTVDDFKTKDHVAGPDTNRPTKSLPPEEAVSFSTMTTDYRTICEEYLEKLVHLEDALTERDTLIEDLTVSLQRSEEERDNLKQENDHLAKEVHMLQHVVAEQPISDHDMIKHQISDFMRYENLIKDDSTKFYSAIMSAGSSVRSSNGEKDMDHEELTVNYSKSAKTSESSNEFQLSFENKLVDVLTKYDVFAAENMRNKFREEILQLFTDEVGKLTMESDKEVKELEGQLQRDKSRFTTESRRLRELLESVQAGSPDLDAVREELGIKHQKEMENLRLYFEQKCTDMERSYSEEVYRGCAAAACDRPEAGDAPRRRTRSAEAVFLESSPSEMMKKLEQQMEELKEEHITYVAELQARHNEAINVLEDQITELKAQIQTTENTVPNVPLYQQDIDLELEKAAVLEALRSQVRREVSEQLQEQVQVLLSNPDAELSSWPLELVALRDKIHGELRPKDKQPPSLCEELSSGEADKWRQKRNHSFDQNRRIEEVTKQRDKMKRAAVTLHCVLSELVAYCAAADRELNQTVLESLTRALLDTASLQEVESRPSSPGTSELNLSQLERNNKHVHFAPDLPAVLAQLDEEELLTYLQEQQDLSLEIKHELELSLKRLRGEAQELFELSCKLGKNRGVSDTSRMLEPSIRITELVEELDSRSQTACQHCTDTKKSMEEALSQCLARENALRCDLDSALIQLAALGSTHIEDIVEGYGLARDPSTPLSLPGRMSLVPVKPASPLSPLSPGSPGSGSQSHTSPGTAQEIVALHREKEDLQQQLEAANRQLRAARQFIDEQVSEREAERDDAARDRDRTSKEIQRLNARLQTNARIVTEMQQLHTAKMDYLKKHTGHVEQLEAQTREMNQIIADLEQRKSQTDDELKSHNDKITLLRDIISDLESKLEQKNNHEKEIVDELETMKVAIEDRDGKLRSVLRELEELRSEKLEYSELVCSRCAEKDTDEQDLMEKIKEQACQLEQWVHYRTSLLERAHEAGGCGDHSEDVSVADTKLSRPEATSPPASPRLPLLCGVWAQLDAHARADSAALKYITDLTRAAQEVRAERDVLQARMSEQALKLSSLAARLELQRSHAAAAAERAAGDLTVRLHDATAEVQRLTEELEAKNKQLSRLKKALEDRDSYSEKYEKLYGNSCNPQEKITILERELASAQSKVAELEAVIAAMEGREDDVEGEHRNIEELKLDADDEKSKSDIIEAAKTSARTLSDIVSISDYDEQDLQMRRAELKPNMNLTGIPYPSEPREKSQHNKTLPPDLSRPNMSSLRLENTDHFDLNHTPRADSLPIGTSTQNKQGVYKRNTNETTIFGFGDSVKHSTAQNIHENCSMYPNRDVDASKDMSLEPKKINFSLEPSHDNKMQDDSISLRDLGITLEVREGNLPDILSQLKSVIKKSKSEIENYKCELKNAEEQLTEFPALKEEVEELKHHLEETVSLMTRDKKFYESQLDNFTSNKKLLEERLTELKQEVTDKAKDLHLLKEDILRRENMILELAKEKRNLTNKMAELEVKIDELQSRNATLEKCEIENAQFKEKMAEFNKLELLVSEKNQQIDSLNQHLDRLDDLQRNLSDKNEEFDNLKEAFEEKSNELFQMQDTVEALNKDIVNLNEENDKLNIVNKELKLNLTKLEKEQENQYQKLQSNENELNRLSSLNSDITSKIEELKQLNDKLKDKETEIEILHEDINSYHEEIATLKEQLKMVSRSPSPRNKSNGEDKAKMADRQASNDKKQLVKIRKQISLLQHELDFNKKELNEKAFELAKAKLDITELTAAVSEANKQVSEAQTANCQLSDDNCHLRNQLEAAVGEKRSIAEQLALVAARIREESNTEELKQKLRKKSEQCLALEKEILTLQEALANTRERECSPSENPERALVLSGARSPTAELERAVREQLDYSHRLDDDIMDQILSASSDNEEIPRLVLNSSKSSSSVHSSSSERLNRLRVENEKLILQVNNLEARLKDKEALITELYRIRDKVVSECQAATQRADAERDGAARLHLLLHTQRDAADTLQNQDANMISILKKRLESSMQNEASLQEQLQEAKNKVVQLQGQLLQGDCCRGDSSPLKAEMDENERLKGELTIIRCKLEEERSKNADIRRALERTEQRAARRSDARTQHCAQLRAQLLELTRQKHEASVELLRAKELLSVQSAALADMERNMNEKASPRLQTQVSGTKNAVLLEISDLKRQVEDSSQSSRRPQFLENKVTRVESDLRDKDQAIRYLHGRCLRLESYRKALVWQKRYLQRTLAGYHALDERLRGDTTPDKPSPLTRFRSAVRAVSALCRLQFLVSRRRRARHVALRAVLAPSHSPHSPHTPHTPQAPQATHTPLGHSPPARDRPTSLDVRGTPAKPYGEVLRSPYFANTPRDEPFILSSPRSETAAAYLSKLDLVNRCLNQALDPSTPTS